MRIAYMILALTGMLSSVRATTLRSLSMSDLIQQSTSIVHVKVAGSGSAFRGQEIYTYYQLQILETLKSGGASTTQVAVPGGVAGGLRQSVAGAPSLSTGGEYVIFLWTSRSGLTQIMGLSQGLFSVIQDQAGNSLLVRPAASGLVLNQSGGVAGNQAVTISLNDLKTQIQQLLGAGH